uniref:LAM_G_DOMAIN domain-containing protein n=1 Tax=Thelazia callipaeda TaxID=103827 RepID=A0A0N5CXB8_THECL
LQFAQNSLFFFSFSLNSKIYAIEWENALKLNHPYLIRVNFLNDQITLAVDDLSAMIFKLPLEINNPLAQISSVYLGYAPIKNLKYEKLEVELWLKSLDPDGLVFYWADMNAKSEYINGDFVALVLIASHAHFFWNLGSGISYCRSSTTLSNDHFHSIRFGRHLRTGFIQVDNEMTTTQTSEAGASYLNVNNGKAFLGNVPNRSILPSEIPEFTVPFRGAIQRLSINELLFSKLLKEFQRFGKVLQYEGFPCADEECQEKSICFPKLNEYSCRNNNCNPNESMQFDGNTEYPLLTKTIRTKRSKQKTDYQFMLKTNESQGLIWWEGTSDSIKLHYLAIFISAGKLTFSIKFNSESKVKAIGSNVIINDNCWHNVKLLREKRKIVFETDKEKIIHVLPPDGAELITNEVIWIVLILGGRKKVLHNFPLQTLFKGCLGDIRIASKLISIEQELSSNRIPQKCKN